MIDCDCRPNGPLLSALHVLIDDHVIPSAQRRPGRLKKLSDAELAYLARGAGHDLENIWLGFTDTNASHDCVCTALSCALRGRQALSVLICHNTVEDSKKAKEDACDLPT